jgi:hypothetical protein
MSDASTWLPDHQLEQATSLGHANLTFNNLLDIYYGYIENDPIDLMPGLNGGREEIRVKHVKPIPPTVSRGASNFLNELRDALEHTVYAEVEHLLGRPLSEKEGETIELPHRDSREMLVKWSKDKRRSTLTPLHEGGVVFERIERLQPYHRVATPLEHPLRLLASLTNRSKHRKPPQLRVFAGPVYTHDSKARHLAVVLQSEPLQPNDVLATVPRGMYMEVGVTPDICIETPLGWQNFFSTLRDVEEWVRLLAMPILITGEYENLLPINPGMDVLKGYTDLREALEISSAQSAADAGSERMMAETLRRSLPDTIELLPSKPNRELAESFTGSLDYSEMLVVLNGFRAAASAEDLLTHIYELERRVRAYAETRETDPLDEGSTAAAT